MITSAISLYAAIIGIADTKGIHLKLTGIPCPYSFYYLSCLENNDYKIISGNGDVVYKSDWEPDRRFKVTETQLNGIYFSNTNIGWVVGNKGKIFHTENGDDWVEQKSEVENSLESIHCIDNECWAVGYSGVILYTSDKGEKWQKQDVNTKLPLHAVHFINSKVGWVVGNDSAIFNTTDGGITWQTQKIITKASLDLPDKLSGDFFDVHFIDEKIGWAVGSDILATTFDGGNSWRASTIDGNFIGAVSENGKNVYAIERSGDNYISNNYGRTWFKQFPNK